jgi:hypothetical protein
VRGQSTKFLFVAAGTMLLVASPRIDRAGQATPRAAPSRPRDGVHGLEGVWSFATLTPLERPADAAGRPFFTD